MGGVYSFVVLKSWKLSLLATLVAFVFFVSFFFVFGGKTKQRYTALKNSVETRQELSVNKSKRLRSSQIRMVLWENSWQAIQKSSFLGYGIGNGKNALQENLRVNNEEFVLCYGYACFFQLLRMCCSGAFSNQLLAMVHVVVYLFSLIWFGV